MGLLSRVKGRLKDEVQRRMEGEPNLTDSGNASEPIPATAGPDTLPDPDVRPPDRDGEPWYLDGELEGWEETNPED